MTVLLKTPKRIAICAQGFFEKSDSIAYDALLQAKLLGELLPMAKIDILADTVNHKYYPTGIIELRSIKDPIAHLAKYDYIIYHYCDGWAEFEDIANCLPVETTLVFRWHNNTPPWFYPSSFDFCRRTVAGYKGAMKLIKTGRWKVAPNSDFSLRQLKRIAPSPFIGSVIYPASTYLELPSTSETAANAIALDEPSIFKLLFVGRIVPHKGQKLIIALAKEVQRTLGLLCEVHLVGRADAPAYLDDIRDTARADGVPLVYHGEVDSATLTLLYKSASAFVCFSQHEGFGLPVFEAMRMSLPVLAWSTTALEDFLAAHPTSTNNFNLQFFIEAIERLADPSFRDSVLVTQEEILKRYTKESLKLQLLRLFTATEVHEPTNKSPLYVYDYFERTEFNPYFTLDDLRIFDEFVSFIEKEKAQKILMRGPGRLVYFDGADFYTHGEKIVTESRALSLPVRAAASEAYTLWFGPYIYLPSGAYQMQFCLSADEALLQSETVLELQLFDLKHGTICGQRISLINAKRSFAGQIVTFDVYVSSELRAAEFRGRIIRADGAGKIELRWVAIGIHNTPNSMLEAVPKVIGKTHEKRGFFAKVGLKNFRLRAKTW